MTKKPKEQEQVEKIKVISPEIIVTMMGARPYYEIKYFDISDCKWHIGYSSYDLKNVIEWKNECFEVIDANDGWIPCSERQPVVETKVLICARRRYRDGTFHYIITTAMYEDGSISEHDSIWNWEDIDGEWDEENDCYIIPEGWWEDKMYNPDGQLNYAVDDEVIKWMPIIEPHKGE